MANKSREPENQNQKSKKFNQEMTEQGKKQNTEGLNKKQLGKTRGGGGYLGKDIEPVSHRR